jgi:cytochrome c peroxidase
MIRICCLLFGDAATAAAASQSTPRTSQPDSQGNETPKAYMHNGYFKTLKGVVNFYNTRDVKPACSSAWVTEEEALRIGCWPAPEVQENVNTDELGNLGLTPAEEDAIVAFMETLSDGYWEGTGKDDMCAYPYPSSP